jgi:hypothetical protein
MWNIWITAGGLNEESSAERPDPFGSNPYVYIVGWNAPALLARRNVESIRRPDRSDSADLQAVGETRPERKPRREFCRPVFASQGQDACGLRGGSGRIQIATVSDGVH